MTFTHKIIDGIKYYYYQDNIRINDKNKTLSTFICRADLAPQELLNAKAVAFVKHIIKLFKTTKKPPFSFEKYRPVEYVEEYLEFIRLYYGSIIKDLTPQELETFRETIFVKYVHGTTAIEGNTLTEGETYTLIVNDLTPKNKSVNEINEVANYTRIREFLENQPDISEKVIKKIHGLMVNNVVDKNGKLFEQGKYRTTSVNIQGVYHSLSRPDKIEQDMEELLKWYQEKKTILHHIELASIFHHRFELIHPFIDYNGRVGREILNLMLSQSGFPPIYITQSQRTEYLNVLQEADLSNYVPLIGFVITRVFATMVYLLSKTRLVEIMQSTDLSNFILNVADQDIVNLFAKVINEYQGSNEIP